MTPAARIAAAIELQELIDFASNRPADAVANDFFRMRRFVGSGDRRWVSDRVWRVLRSRRRLEWWFGGPPTPRLLIAASLMFEGAAIVALSEIFSGAQYAPAAFDRVERALLARLEGRTLDHTGMSGAVRWEIPDWVYPRLEARFGADLPAELEKLQEPAALDLRYNPLKTTRDGARTALATEGHDAVPTALSPWGLRIQGRRQVTTGAAFQTGLVEIQDEGSQLIAVLVGATPGMRVVDYCAGAGGKTLAIAGTMENKGQLVACDVSATRLDAAVRRLRRAGVHNVERHLLEPGDKWSKRREASFDRVLVDAPCTGTGTWRRNPDARLRLTENDLLELVPKQAAILDAAQALVRKGGQLVYATCSLLPEENEAQVSAFLDRHPNFAVVPLPQAWTLPGEPPCTGDFLSLTPARHGADGFFGAVLERMA